jgi:polysaccharide export outer membrane protein
MKQLARLASTLVVLAASSLAQSSANLQTNADQQQSSSFGANLPIMPVGVDDLIAVQVYDSPELTRTVRVSADGTIRMPMLKQKIKIDGMMPSVIETAIAKQLEDEGILVDPVVTVSVAEYRSRPISVTGAVKNPTTLQALPGTTLLDAITKAEGLSEDAGDVILVSRSIPGVDGKVNKMTQRISAKGLLENTDPSLNIPLQGDEQVLVPDAGRVYVVGNVKMPGAIKVHEAGDITVLKALAMSQGLDRFPNKMAYIFRREGAPNQDGIPVELSRIMDRKSPDVSLQPNDILYVPEDKRKKMTLGTIEKVFGIGSATIPAVIYTVH